MRSALLSCLCAALAGCAGGAGDPCADHAGACLGLRVEGPQGSIDQLAVRLQGAARLDGSTPSPPGPAQALPVTTAIYLPEVSGAVQLSVEGLLGGRVVGRAEGSATLVPGQHQTLTLTLTREALDGGAADLSVDLAPTSDGGEDAMVPADLNPPPDLSGPPDLLPPPPRYVFIAPSVTGAGVAGLAGADTKCQAAATAAALPGVYKAVLTTNGGADPKNTLSLNQGRLIILPTGVQVATDATFFSATHATRIDKLANGGPATDACVWTDFTELGGVANGGDCTAWTGTTGSGYVGSVLNNDATWARQSVQACTVSCHLYCLQQ